MPGFGFGLRPIARRRRLPRGGAAPARTPAPTPTPIPTPTPAPGTSATTFAALPAVHYHPHSQSVVVDGSDRLTSCPDRRGLAQLLAVAGATAPKQLTDALGRKFLRFNGSEAAAIENALTVASNRGYMALLVARVHHHKSTCQMLNPRFAAYTSPTVNTQANSSIGYLRATSTADSAPFLQGGAPAASTNAADCYKAIPGAQLQVIAIASRVTASGGTRCYINNDTCDVAQQTTAVSNYIGAVVGGTRGASNTENLTTSVDNVFDLYELAFWNTGPLNADSDAAVAAAVINYGVAQLDTNYVLEGDSITDGIATALSESPVGAKGLGSRLTEPGASLVAANVRVLNQASSGAQTSTLVTRRDAVNSIFASGRYPGGAAKNIVAVQIGRNDVSESAGKKNSATLYADIVALINTATTGYLQRGWKVVQVANIAGPATAVTTNVSPAGENTIQLRIEGLRAKLMSAAAIHPTFAADTLSGAGQAYDGLVSVLPVSEITVSGDTKFNTAADANDFTTGIYYDNDQTHLRVAGIDLMASGGDTPAYGYGVLA